MIEFTRIMHFPFSANKTPNRHSDSFPTAVAWTAKQQLALLFQDIHGRWYCVQRRLIEVTVIYGTIQVDYFTIQYIT